MCRYPQLLDVDPEDAAEEEGANVDLDSQRKGKCAVIKTSTRQVRGADTFHLLYCMQNRLLAFRWLEEPILSKPLSHFQTYFLPVIGLVDPENLKPGDLVGVNKDSYLILDTLPAE